MSDNYFNYDEIKRKIRKLKKLEVKIRFGNISLESSNNACLVWDEFFNLKELSKNNVKYSIDRLATMNKDEFKDVISEYFFIVYYRFYRENGIINVHLYDPYILTQMGLPFDSEIDDVKKRFRELAKKYHPDTGGDNTKFIELMGNYKKLVDN